MSLAAAPGPTTGPGTGTRGTQRVLRAEKAQLAHWRRLLRARLDLAVAGLAPPEPLGTLSWDVLPEALVDLPRPEDLRSAVTVPNIEDTVDLMTRIRALDKALGRYSRHLDEALDESTEGILRDLAAERP